MTLPSMLYRGDSDPSGVRQLRICFPGSASGGMVTNLSNGGDGLAFVKASLTDLVVRHVSPGWPATHFLSFSEHRARALAFAAGSASRTLIPASKANWEALLVRLDTTRFIQCDRIGVGLYLCTFSRSVEGPLPDLSIPEWIMRSFDKLSRNPVRVLLVDAVTFFSHCLSSGVQGLAPALANSQRDAEWLVLPLDAAPEIAGERTCKLDDGCIESIDFFQFAGA